MDAGGSGGAAEGAEVDLYEAGSAVETVVDIVSGHARSAFGGGRAGEAVGDGVIADRAVGSAN